MGKAHGGRSSEWLGGQEAEPDAGPGNRVPAPTACSWIGADLRRMYFSLRPLTNRSWKARCWTKSACYHSTSTQDDRSFNNKPHKTIGMPESEVLSELDITVLRQLLKAKRIEDLAKEVDQSPATLGREIAKLQLGGYIADDGSITAKGVEAAKAS